MELPTDPATRLRLVAAGRREYAQSAPRDQKELLLIQAACYETAAKAITDDVTVELQIPTWFIGNEGEKK